MAVCSLTISCVLSYIYIHIFFLIGGGPSKHKDDPLLEKVCTLIGPTMDGMYTKYDGDSALMASQDTEPVEGGFPIHSVSPASFFNNVENDQPLFTNNRCNLKRLKSNPKLTSKCILFSVIFV